MPEWKNRNWFDKTGYSLAGLRDALKTEKAVKEETVALAALTVIAFVKFGFSNFTRVIEIFFAGLAPIILELINTAFEIITDLACGTEYNEKIRMAKDMLSGAMFLTFILCYSICLMLLLK